jgi:hypothetical protein
MQSLRKLYEHGVYFENLINHLSTKVHEGKPSKGSHFGGSARTSFRVQLG